MASTLRMCQGIYIASYQMLMVLALLAMTFPSKLAWDSKNSQEQEMKLPVLLASDTLRALWNTKSKKVWNLCLGATPDSCEEYWRKAGSTWAHSHPVVTNQYHAETIPDTRLARHTCEYSRVFTHFSRVFTPNKGYCLHTGEILRGRRGIQDEPRNGVLDLVFGVSGRRFELQHQVLIWSHPYEASSNQDSSEASKRKDGGCHPVGS